METTEKRILLFVGAVASAAIASVLAVAVRILLLGVTPDAGEPGSNHNPSGTFLFGMQLLVFLIAACSISYVLFSSSNLTKTNKLLYIFVTIFVGAFSFANYSSLDTLVPISFQAILNLVLAIFSVFTVRILWLAKFESFEAKVISYAGIFFVSGFLIFLPVIASLLFFLYKLGFLTGNPEFTLDGIKDTIIVICTIVGLLITVLKYRDEKSRPGSS